MGGSGVTFLDDHAREQLTAAHPGWVHVWGAALDVDRCEIVRDVAKQRLGCDHALFKGDRFVAHGELKIRDKDYGDFALEIVSNDQARPPTPGWIEKQLECDWFLYCIRPTRSAWLFRYRDLRRAWVDNRAAWLAEFPVLPTRRDRNEGYRTWNVMVPRQVVIDASDGARLIVRSTTTWQAIRV